MMSIIPQVTAVRKGAGEDGLSTVWSKVDMDPSSAGADLSPLVARLSDLADPAGCWTIRSEEVVRLVGADPVRFWREVNGLRHRISFGEAIDGFTQNTVGDLVTVLEHLFGGGAEEAMRRAGLFLPHGFGVELTNQLLHAARRFSAAHDIRTDELLAMIRHAGGVRAAIGIYLGEYADPESLLVSCAESFRAMQGLPGIGAATAARYLRRMFEKHVLDRRGLFTLLEERLRLAAAQAGHLDPEDRERADGTDHGAGRGARRGAGAEGPAARQETRSTWALRVMGFARSGEAPDADALRARYRQLMMRHHPDVDPSGLERCKDVNVAYALLIAGTAEA
jgi:hypothetical protein